MYTAGGFQTWGSGGTSRSWQGSRGGRGRGRGRGTWYSTPRYKPAFTPSPEPALGPLLSSLTPADVLPEAKNYKSQSVITECKTVASYNWLGKTEPTIVVPGKPPKWTPPHEPRQLKYDEGEYFRDPNAAHYPKHPIEPAIIAALAMEPDVPHRIDIVGCGSTLGNLLRFIREEDKPFRILVELVNDTVFFVRRENTPRELIDGIRGYGHTFPEAYTTWDSDVKSSTSHQRVISYRFGGLGFLVRFQGDGYLADEVVKENRDGPHVAAAPASIDNEAVDALLEELTSSRVTPATPAKENEELKVTYAGDLIKQDCIFELKTRSVRRKEADTFEDTFGDQLPRLWISQVPKFILAYHTQGLFEDISVRDTKSEVKNWEKDHADTLSRFAALIHHIVGVVKSRPDRKLELRNVDFGTLEVREQLAEAGDALSESVRSLWENTETGGYKSPVSSEAESASEERVDFEDWNDEVERDYTACSAEDCGYCGRCDY